MSVCPSTRTWPLAWSLVNSPSGQICRCGPSTQAGGTTSPSGSAISYRCGCPALLAGDSRAAFRSTLAVDAATWARGRGWALWKALITLAGAPDRSAPVAAAARHVIDELRGDFAADSHRRNGSANPQR